MFTCICLPSECRQANTVGLHVSSYPRNVEVGWHSRLICIYLPSECRDRPTQQGYMYLSTLGMQRQTDTVELHVSIYPQNVEIGQHCRATCFYLPSEFRDRPTQQGYMFLSTLRMQRQANTVGLHVSIYPRNVEIDQHSRVTCFYLPSECRDRPTQQGYMFLSTLGMQRQAGTVGLNVSIYPRNVEIGRHSRVTCFYLPSECRGRLTQQGYMCLSTFGMQRQADTVGLHVSIYPRNVEIDRHSRVTCIYLPSECRDRPTRQGYMFLSTLRMQRQANTVGLHVSIYPRNVEVGWHRRVTCIQLPSECRGRLAQQAYMYLSTLGMQRQADTVGLHVSIYPRNVEIDRHSRVTCIYLPSECRDRPTLQGYMFLSTLRIQRQANTVGLHVSIYPQNVEIGQHSRVTCFYLPSECRDRPTQQGYMFLSTLGMQRQADTVGLHVSIYPRNVEVGWHSRVTCIYLPSECRDRPTQQGYMFLSTLGMQRQADTVGLHVSIYLRNVEIGRHSRVTCIYLPSECRDRPTQQSYMYLFTLRMQRQANTVGLHVPIYPQNVEIGQHSRVTSFYLPSECRGRLAQKGYMFLSTLGMQRQADTVGLHVSIYPRNVELGWHSDYMYLSTPGMQRQANTVGLHVSIYPWNVDSRVTCIYLLSECRGRLAQQGYMYQSTLGMQRQAGTVGLNVSIYHRNVEIDQHSRLTCIYLPSECRGRLTQQVYMYLSTLGMQRQAGSVGLHVFIYSRNVEVG